MPASEINPDEAETIALKALEFILAEADLQNKFITSSGLTAKAIHDSIQNKEFLGGVLDFLLGQEEELVKFCQKYEMEPTQPSLARASLDDNKVEEA